MIFKIAVKVDGVQVKTIEFNRYVERKEIVDTVRNSAFFETVTKNRTVMSMIYEEGDSLDILTCPCVIATYFGKFGDIHAT